MLTAPTTTNMMRQPAKESEDGACCAPKEISPPRIWPVPRPQYQRPKRGVASAGVYHRLV
jgi:hypothetical protein